MNFDAYKNTDPYPVSPTRIPGPGLGAKPEDIRRFADELEKFHLMMEIYRKEQNEWRQKQNMLEAQFRVDALREVGLEGHPKADIVYSKAWDLGHASGLSEVFYWLKDLAELVIESKETT